MRAIEPESKENFIGGFVRMIYFVPTEPPKKVSIN